MNLVTPFTNPGIITFCLCFAIEGYVVKAWLWILIITYIIINVYPFLVFAIDVAIGLFLGAIFYCVYLQSERLKHTLHTIISILYTYCWNAFLFCYLHEYDKNVFVEEIIHIYIPKEKKRQQCTCIPDVISCLIW